MVRAGSRHLHAFAIGRATEAVSGPAPGRGAGIPFAMAMVMQPATTTTTTPSTPRILLVGDDVGISVAARMLRARGYDVVQTRGEHAAQHCTKPVDLLVTSPDRKVIQDVRSKSGRIPVLLLERDASHVTTDVPRVAASLFGKVAPEQLVKAVRLACPREPALSDDPLPARR
jgi:hypothetical protein